MDGDGHANEHGNADGHGEQGEGFGDKHGEVMGKGRIWAWEEGGYEFGNRNGHRDG